MSFIPDPDQFEDFPEDADDYESQGYQHLDTDGKYIIELFANMDIEISQEYIDQIINDLIVEGGLAEFAVQLESYSDYFLPPENLPKDSLRANPFFSADDAMAYLAGIPGYAGFAGITWINDIWHVWIGDTI